MQSAARLVDARIADLIAAMPVTGCCCTELLRLLRQRGSTIARLTGTYGARLALSAVIMCSWRTAESLRCRPLGAQVIVDRFEARHRSENRCWNPHALGILHWRLARVWKHPRTVAHAHIEPRFSPSP